MDTAGTYGPTTNITAFINQPPDYLLHANINSMLQGDWNNVSETDKAPLVQVVDSAGFVGTTAVSTWSPVRSDVGVSTGAWYWEVLYSVAASGGKVMLGVGSHHCPECRVPGHEAGTGAQTGVQASSEQH